MIIQAVNNLAQTCARMGIQQAVCSPGSRCAPLLLAFSRHPNIHCTVVPDERTAAFMALGMAQASGKPVVLICTSGSALYNYAPAVAEAYFSEVPLLLLTADRPPEWIGQWDGQTIFQQGIYGKHVKQSLQFPVDTQHPDAKWHAERLGAEAVNACQTLPQGPVHLNIPIREPFYPAEGEAWHYDEVKVIQTSPAQDAPSPDTLGALLKAITNSERPLIVAGQMTTAEAKALPQLEKLSGLGIPIVGDAISNLHHGQDFIHHPDNLLLSPKDAEKAALRPDLLITLGKSVISKNLKLFLRAHQPSQHWHLGGTKHPADPFQSLTNWAQGKAGDYLEYLAKEIHSSPPAWEGYQESWTSKEHKAQKGIEAVAIQQDELSLLQYILAQIPKGAQLHLANSMAVRYVNFLGVPKGVEAVWSNRGTSGIDGCTSTALGHALAQPDKEHWLITGDVAFFYDHNAFWFDDERKPNLKVILLNNSGGNIFRMIPGPSAQQELERFFETRHQRNAAAMAQDFGIPHHIVKDTQTLQAISGFLKDKKRTAIIECLTLPEDNENAFSTFKAQQKELIWDKLENGKP